jgi:hypothetical protein
MNENLDMRTGNLMSRDDQPKPQPMFVATMAAGE